MSREGKKTTLRLKAEDRAAALQKHYDDVGRLTLEDVRRITGTQCAAVLQSLNFHGLTYPPVWDSREEKYKRKAAALWDKAKEFRRDYLTIKEAAKVLGSKPSDVRGLEGRLRKAGLELPDIRDVTRPAIEYELPPAPVSNSNKADMHYPQGLQVLTCWPGPGDNQITYLLR